MSIPTRAGRALWAFCLLSAVAAFTALSGGAAQAAAPDGKSLRAFASQDELNAWLQEKKKLYEQQRKSRETVMANKAAAAPAASPAPALAQADAAGESVTNVQTAGVDEGGIVKVHKDHLVILRRGRLFTVRIGGGALQPVDMQDAFAPDSKGGGAWYDEMLIAGDTVIVIGYSYGKGGTEVGLFNIGDDGRLSYRATYVLRSNDYYSSRNYASRLIGNTLIFYTPLYLNFYGDPLDNFPAAFRWQKDESSAERKRPAQLGSWRKELNAAFKPIAPATRIYRSADDLDPTHMGIALHTVTTCEIAADKLDCSATAVLGPAGREFYVARDAVYVWAVPFHGYRSGETGQAPVSASIFRLPLNAREAPTALKTWGSPIDQFSFLESADGYLNVLIRAEGTAPSMWASERGSRDIALLRTPLRDFGDGTTSAPPEHYHPLPAPEGGHSIQNRYIGEYLVYGAGQTWRRQQESAPNLAYLLKWSDPDQVEGIFLPHRVDRIEAWARRRFWWAEKMAICTSARSTFSPRWPPSRGRAPAARRRCPRRHRRGWRASPAPSSSRMPPRAKPAATVSSTNPTRATAQAACWGCLTRAAIAAAGSSSGRRPAASSFCKTTNCACPKPARSPRLPMPKKPMTNARRPAPTGTATRARCLSPNGFSR